MEWGNLARFAPHRTSFIGLGTSCVSRACGKLGEGWAPLFRHALWVKEVIVFRKSLVFLVTFLLLAGASAALAQTGNPGNGNPGNGNPGNGNGCNNGNAGNNNPNCPGPYPAQSSTVVRDANGNIIDGTHGLYVGDPMNIVSDGWMPNSMVAFDFLSTVIHLGDVAADASGVVRATFLVPDVEPGQHTLRLTGTGPDGQPRVVEYPILVLARSQPSQVLGQTLTNAGGSAAGRTGGGLSAFGKTGLDQALAIAGIGLALFAIGLALTLAVRRSRADALA